MIVTLRRSVGRLALVGGSSILLYQGMHFKQTQMWKPFSLTVVVEAIVHFIGEVMAFLPFVAPEGVEMFQTFNAADLPGVLFRFFHVIPLSAFLLAMGYFFLKWEKYLG